MSWAEADWLWLLWSLPVLVLCLWGIDRKLRKRFGIYTGKSLAALTLVKWWQFLMSFAVLACIIIALARPRAGFEWRDIERSGAEIMMVVDVSQSMLAEDIKPNRLQRARREIVDLVGMLQGDRIGLALFAGVGFVQCPLTLDYGAVSLFLDHIDPGNIPVQGTAIGDALRLAIKSLQETDSSSSVEKAIILITDGEDHESGPLAAAREAADAGIKIYTIGMGSEGGAPVPKEGGGFVKDQGGQLVMSRLDEATLIEIAETTGGTYVRSTSGDLDLDVIYRQHIRSDLTQGTLGESREKIWYEHYWIFSLIAAGIWLFEFVFAARTR